MLVCVYTCQNATLLEITCHGSNIIAKIIKLEHLHVVHYDDTYNLKTNYKQKAGSFGRNRIWEEHILGLACCLAVCEVFFRLTILLCFPCVVYAF